MSGEPSEIARRVQQLQAAFEHIARTKMSGVAMLHPSVHVEAIGFEPQGAQAALGVLVTPWFMNLVWLPVAYCSEHAVGRKLSRELGTYVVEFTSAFEPAIGGFEVCSLFSPLTEFADHEAVVATAREVLAGLRATPATEVASTTSARGAISRRAVLFGRGGAGARG